MIDLPPLPLPDGWTRRNVHGAFVISAEHPAGNLVIPLSSSGRCRIQWDLYTPANRRDLAMQYRLDSQQTWRRLRPMRFLANHDDAIQTVSTEALTIQPGDALHIRTEPASGIAIAGLALAPEGEPLTKPPPQRHVGLVYDSAMSLSTYRVDTPDDLHTILRPLADSHVSHLFWGTGVGTYNPLYESPTLGWHGRDQKSFKSDHRTRVATVMRRLMAAGVDPLSWAVDAAHEQRLQLWANHRISKNHAHDVRDDYPGGRFLQRHHDKLVCVTDGTPHYQMILSHAYPEIRAATVEALVEQAAYGVDGLYIDFLRKSPIVGWEPKSLADFEATHGYDPRQERPSDFRQTWLAHLRTYPTQLLRELRAALAPVEQRLGRRMPIAVNVLGGWKFSDGIPACAFDGLDPFRWAKEGLVDVVIPGHDLWLEPQCLDHYVMALQGTTCELWGAIGPQNREGKRSTQDGKHLGNEHADIDPWRYLAAAHDFYGQGASGVALWEAHDISSVPQIWETTRHRIGSPEILTERFGQPLGSWYDPQAIRRRVLTPQGED